MPNTPTTSSSGASSSAHPSTVRHSDVHPIPRAISHLQNLFTTQLATLQSAMQGPHSSSRAHPSPTSSSATPSTAPSLHPTSPTNTPHPAHSVHTDASHAGDPGRRHSGSACRPAASASSSLQWPSRSTAACSSSSNRSRPVHPAALSRLPLCCCSLSNPQANRRGAKQHSGSAGGGSGSTPCDCSSCNASSAAPLGSGHRSVPGSAPHLPTASDSSTASQPPQAASDAERKQRGAAARGTAATGAVPEPASVCIAAAVCVPGGAAAAAALEAVRSTPDHLQGVKLLFSGAMAALVSRTCVAPFERVKMDLVLKSGTGDALSTALQVWRTEGVTGFWHTNALHARRTAPFKAINFFSFDTYLRALTEADILGPNVSRFAAGAMAGVTATLICFPLDVVRTRLLATLHQGPRYGGPLSTLQGMLRNEGIHSLYSGARPDRCVGSPPRRHRRRHTGRPVRAHDLLKRRHLDQLDCTCVGEYGGPAGGWGALRAVAGAISKQLSPVRETSAMLRMNQPDGFDCPGCAWPDPKHTSSFEFCENGAKAVSWEATSKRATPEFFAAHTVSELWGWHDHALENEGRLTHPMAYDKVTDTYVELSWEQAMARIGAGLRALPDPNMAEFYTSGRASNEAAFLYQLFAREYGTNNTVVAYDRGAVN
ncbi:MAG: hypothetical protein WDW38_009785 [Sanguina aurantia]